VLYCYNDVGGAGLSPGLSLLSLWFRFRCFWTAEWASRKR